MSRNNKRNLLRSIFRANGGCGNCGNPKPFDIYDPTPKPKICCHPNPDPPTTVTSSASIPQSVSAEDSMSGKLSGSVVVEMKSENPYNDFKDSIIQMIMEREIYSASEVGELLQWFLKLNLPCHHQLILRAFADICQQASPPS
ncbi:transcription repressor OFP6-like [Neltuma alba]|uniref:transcription repressor OFP6-like n=1 Tax=Neltuma alba TaxID=207710 RepID=UPI0010A369B4|nr:transcription repressor OFP6-like [Prosopis alba]